MGKTSEFSVIPALDLKEGIVVHAKAGNRADYAPIASPFGAADDPVAIAGGLLAATGSPVLYIADLDAIAGTGEHFELVRGLADALHGTALWIDAGFSNVSDCAFWLPLGATLVIGSESLAGIEPWLEMQGAFGESVVLSLDFDAAGRRGPAPLFDDPALWPARIIAMSLAMVGTGMGPDLDRIEEVVAAAEGRAIYAAGGVRDARDLGAISKLGAQGALLGTSLHSGAVTQKEIAALLRERRP
jgi:HisA/HisF family protein